MVKSYQRYELERTFGVVASPLNLVYIPPADSRISFGRAVAAGLEEVLLWDLKTGELVQRLADGLPVGAADAVATRAPPAVVQLAHHQPTGLVAAGYADGSIKVWDLTSALVLMLFTGHKSAVTKLVFDRGGTRLVSGARDASVVVWDLVGEVGLFRLKGHHDEITGVELVRGSLEGDDLDDYLVSTSKDGLVKVWDLAAQQCVETHVAHSGECWAMARSEDLVITGGRDSTLKVWRLDVNASTRLAEVGVFDKQLSRRSVEVVFHTVASHRMFAVVNGDRSVELFRVRTADEISKREKKKRRDLEKEGFEGEEVETKVHELVVARTIARFTSVTFGPAKPAAKITGFAFGHASALLLDLVVALNTNSIVTTRVELPANLAKHNPASGVLTSSAVAAIELPGHRRDIRSVDISDDDRLVVLALDGQVKVWSAATGACVRLVSDSVGYCLSVKFLPGGTMVVVGTKQGKLCLYDLALASLVQEVDAHAGEVWSVDVMPDGRGVVSGSLDKSVRFWDVKVEQQEVPGSDKTFSTLALVPQRRLDLPDLVLGVRVSPDARLLAVSLLDTTVKVFFVDSLKFFLLMYGHKLPVLLLDISADLKLLVTLSADKNIKLWGLDFGDCHRLIFAHQDLVMCVRFVGSLRLVVLCLKDRTVKMWDGDKFECIQTLAVHQGEVWAVAAAHDGLYVVLALHDHLVRVWQELGDQVFLEEEREKALEEQYHTELVGLLEGTDGDAMDEEETEVAKATTATIDLLKAGERLLEALDVAEQDMTRTPTDTRNPLLVATNVDGPTHVLLTVLKIKPLQLEDALLVLPFSYSARLLRCIGVWTSSTAARAHTALVCRVLFLVVRNNAREIAGQRDDAGLKAQLASVSTQLRATLREDVDRLGVNGQGLRHVQRVWRELHHTEYVDEYEQAAEERSRARKRQYQTVA